MRWSMVHTVVLQVAALLTSAAPAVAQPAAIQPLQAQPRPRLAQLRQLIESARAKLRPVAAEKIQTARETLHNAVARLERFLDRSGENGVQWRKYLAVDVLKQAIAPDSDVKPVFLDLVQVRFNAKHAGLEDPEFADVAAALRQYRELTRTAAAIADRDEFEKRLDPLIKLTGGEFEPTDLRAASESLGLLDTAEVAPEVVVAVRDEFSRPNLLFEVEESFVDEELSKIVDKWATSNECKGRSFTHAHTHTLGKTNSEFVPNEERGVLRTVMKGTAHTNATTQQRSAIVAAHATTGLFGHVTVNFDEYGVNANCAMACANTSICFTGFGSTRCGMLGRVVTRIASRQAPKQRGKAEQEANHKAAQKLAQNLNEQAAEQVKKMNEKYREDVRLPLIRYNAFPRYVRAATTSDRLTVTVIDDDRFHLAAPTDPPPISSGIDMTLRMHESFFNNLMNSVFANRKVNEEDMIEFFGHFQTEEKAAQEKQELAETSTDKRWAITFPDSDPITIRVDGNIVTLTIRGRRFESGETKIDNTNIVARYTLTHRGGEVLAQRDAELYILPEGRQIGEELGARETARTGPLRKRLEGETTPPKEPVFKKEMTIHGIKLGEKFAHPGTMPIRQWFADDGWLLVGWKVNKGEAGGDIAGAEPTHDKVSLAE